MESAAKRAQLIDILRNFPETLTQTVSHLSQTELTTRSLPEEWTIQEIVHHLADSHMNSVIRLKLILTTERPTLQGYDQDSWVTLPDVAYTSIEESLLILRGLHVRWCALWDHLMDDQWQRVGIHTENGPVTPDDLLVTYVEHCQNHLAQIKRVLAAIA